MKLLLTNEKTPVETKEARSNFIDSQEDIQYKSGKWLLTILKLPRSRNMLAVFPKKA